jgi:hypothetical protein
MLDKKDYLKVEKKESFKENKKPRYLLGLFSLRITLI